MVKSKCRHAGELKKLRKWLAFLSILGCWLLVGAEDARGAAPRAGKLINLQGQVLVVPARSQNWQPAEINQDLFVGDAIKTGPDSKAAILCADESQIKLNENTLLVLNNVAQSTRLGYAEVQPAAAEGTRSLYQVTQGEIWLRNNKEKFPFAVETPALTAAIRGTEFNLRVSQDGATYLTLLGGSLHLVNDYGQVVLQPGEEGMARPGQAPTKRVIVQPADAVQWSLYYPGIFSFRDISLALPFRASQTASGPPAAANLVFQAEANYDRGRLGPARNDAETALQLDPGNGGALTVLGWLSLQHQEPKEAEQYFLQVRNPNDRALAGLALARYRLGDVTGSYRLLQEARVRLEPSPLLATMAGFMALMVGKVEEATIALQAVVQQWPRYTLARCLLAQIYLVQNRKDRAREEAIQALGQGSASPLARLTMALVNLASFDLASATNHLQEALTLDPRFVTAYVYLAKIQLGGGYLSRAWNTIQRALDLAPREAEVLTLAGFVRLAFRDYGPAENFFKRAVAANPGLGEPYLGLGIYNFRYRQMDRGLAGMLTATLLEPRISLYQSELGKALYQTRAFDKALQVYDYAKTLDKNDPTPYLYKGIALTDLNRPAEAVQEFNRSMELNDNQAIFRSRIMLDRDQAVSNYNLALAYNELGLSEWAYSKAVTAVQKSPTSSSAYLFLSNSYAATRQRLGAAGSSLLLYKLLSPANQNTFSTYNDYTPMFEMPYWRGLVQGGVGSWQERKSIQEHSVEVYGGLPGLAFDAFGGYNEDRGFRKQNGDSKNYSVIGIGKWEPTVKNSLLATFSYLDVSRGDDSNLNDFAFANSPYLRRFSHWRTYEAGYVHRFNPNATLLAYFNYAAHDDRQKDFESGSLSLPGTLGPYTDPLFPPGWFAFDQGTNNYDYQTWLQRLTPMEFYNFQVQQQLILGDHTLMGGFDYFSGHLKYRTQFMNQVLYKNFTYGNNTSIYDNFGNLIFSGPFWQPYTIPYNLPQGPIETILAYRPPDRSYSFYLLDYWRLHPKLLVELGLFKDYAKNSRFGFATPIYNNKWSPRLGINYQVNDKHMLRLVLQEHVNTHDFVGASLVPPEIASFPWQINVDNGAQVREAGAAWEAQWNPKTFSVLRLDAHRISVPLYEVNSTGAEPRVQWMWKRYLASLTVNRILGRYFGMSLGCAAKKIDPNFIGSHDYKEYNAFGQLVFWHPSGLRAWFNTFGLKQDLTDRGDNLFGLLNASVGYEFPGKRGLATLEVDNLLNRHFFYQREFVTLDAFFPARRILFKLALYF